MNTRFLMIAALAAVMTVPALSDQAYALCAEEIDYDLTLENSEFVFTGTVTRLDNYGGPQKVTFLLHDVIKGEINTEKFVFENSRMMFLANDTIGSSSLDVDYKIGKTYKVYVTNGDTSSCTTMVVSPPADYIWGPGPEDGNYYSENPVYVEPCDEGYGLSDDVCITLEEMNRDLPTCSANPRHDFGKCKKNMEDPPNTFEQVKASCNDGGDDVFLEWWDDDVYFNNDECEVLDRSKPGPAPAHSEPAPEPEPGQYAPTPENCGPGTVLQDGICVVTSKQESSDGFEKYDSSYQKMPSPNILASCSFDGIVVMWFYQFVVHPLCEIGIHILPDYDCYCDV